MIITKQTVQAPISVTLTHKDNNNQFAAHTFDTLPDTQYFTDVQFIKNYSLA